MTHASVFSGIGGPEVAATMLGWKNLFHCEINPTLGRVGKPTLGRVVWATENRLARSPENERQIN